MRILAVIRQVLDAEETVRLRNGEVDLSASKLVVDAMDEYGVEQALRIRESGVDAEVIALAVGPERSQEALRTVLAMGADRAIHVETELFLDPIALSKVAAQVAKQENVDLVFFKRVQTGENQAVGKIRRSSVIVVDCRARSQAARDLNVQESFVRGGARDNAGINRSIEDRGREVAGCHSG